VETKTNMRNLIQDNKHQPYLTKEAACFQTLI
jgi:hypothetical protein